MELYGEIKPRAGTGTTFNTYRSFNTFFGVMSITVIVKNTDQRTMSNLSFAFPLNSQTQMHISVHEVEPIHI
jgi:hypothetical protein